MRDSQIFAVGFPMRCGTVTVTEQSEISIILLFVGMVKKKTRDGRTCTKSETRTFGYRDRSASLRNTEPSMDNSAALTGHVEQQANSDKPVAKPRGRPKGSKNKPKFAPPIHLDDSRGDMNFHFLEIQRGEFVIASVTQLASKFVQRGGGMFVLGAKGLVSSVSVLDNSHNRRFLVGTFQILSLSGTLGSARNTTFTITLSDQKFQAWGGNVFGDFQAVQGSVVVKAVSYEGPDLPIAAQLQLQSIYVAGRPAGWLGIGEGSRQVPISSQRQSMCIGEGAATANWLGIGECHTNLGLNLPQQLAASTSSV